MGPSTRRVAPTTHRSQVWLSAIPALAVALMFLPTAGLTAPSAGHDLQPLGLPSAGAAPSSLSSAAVTPSAAAQPSATPTPSAVAFNPNCYPVDTGICVSIMNPGEANIIPTGHNRTSSVMPDCSQSIPLVVKSHDPLNATNSPKFGPHAPVFLNVTGTLWNGDPYFSQYDDSIWHSNTNTWWTLLNNGPENNNSYPWWYMVNLSASGSGGPNFFPGEQVNWWITIVYALPNSFYVTHEGPHLTYTCAGAWPYSPYPGSPHYGGPSSIFLDTNISLSPRQPNWNDSVFVTVNTTQVDVAPYNATIGAATLDLVEVAHGLVIANTSWSFNVTVNSGFGNTTITTRIPELYAQVEGATISYRIWVSDTSKVQDWLVSPWTNYSVNGNGSFATGSFTSDLTLLTNPVSVQLDNPGFANLTPGQPLALKVISRNPTDAILAVEVRYSVAYPLLHETITQSVELKRISSIYFRGSIPGLPMETIVNFTVFAWDFTDASEVSDQSSYTVETLDQYHGPVDPGLAFFYVFVYDNGSGTWVQGATVQVLGPNGVLNSVSKTTLGVAYANQTGTPFLPILVQANATYNVTVTDPSFVPTGLGIPYGGISVAVRATNPMTSVQPLASNANYIVIQQGNEILFYLNGSAPSATTSPTTTEGNALGAIGLDAVIGLIASAIVAGPFYLWWRQIKARRTAEEKRVTL